MRILPLDSLPPLAWLADLDPLQPVAVCGRDVETFADGLFEGVWAGDFAAQDFGSVRHVFGSGVRRRKDGWLVVTPSHTLEGVYLLERGGRYVVSNSLAFLTQWNDLALPFDSRIAARMITVRDGTDCYERALFLGDGWSIRRACFDNLELGTGAPRWVTKPPLDKTFTGFAAYRAYLLDELGLLIANGTDPRRRFRYELTTTCSSGYDSTACAVLAAELGARRGFTIAGARDGGDDSGRRLLERLGLEAIEVDRAPRPSGPECPEAEFIATGTGGDEFPFAPFGPHLCHTILLSGFGGERLWGCTGPVSRNAHQDDDPAGASLAEFRLRCSFVHLPVGWIGFEGQPELRRICTSTAMAPWRTGTSYERPIARRLIEEAGIPRGAFAVAKHATSMRFYFASYWWSKAAIDELRELERKALPGLTSRLVYRADGLFRTAALTAYFAAGRVSKRLGLADRLDRLRDRLFPGFWGFAYTHPRYGSMAFLWGQAKVQPRYPRARDLTPGLAAGALGAAAQAQRGDPDLVLGPVARGAFLAPDAARERHLA